MYQYPYGDTQQLNLNWVIKNLIELKQSIVAGESAELEQFANALISLTYIPTQAYNNSDIVFHDGHLYRCNTTIPAPGEVWDPSHWDQIMLGNTVANLVRAVAGMNSDHVFNESNVSGTHVTEALNALVEDVRYDNHKIQQKKNGAYADVIPVEDTPSNNSDRLASSKAAYDLKGAINDVQGQISTYIETGNTASRAYSKGQYVVWKGNLYRVISAISNGGAFTSGTNIVSVSVGNELTPELLTKQNIANSYFDLTDSVNFVQMARVGNIYLLKIRIAPSSEIPARTSDFNIATFNLTTPLSFGSTYVVAPSQYGEAYAPLTLQVSQYGTIVVANNHQTKTALGFYMANFSLI